MNLKCHFQLFSETFDTIFISNMGNPCAIYSKMKSKLHMVGVTRSVKIKWRSKIRTFHRNLHIIILTEKICHQIQDDSIDIFYDMEWPRRASGNRYNSLSIRDFIILVIPGKVIWICLAQDVPYALILWYTSKIMYLL